MEDLINKIKLLKLQITISGEIIKGRLDKFYSYNENTDLSSNLSDFYIPTKSKLVGKNNFNYKDLLDKKKVEAFSRDYSIVDFNSQLFKNVEFLINLLFKTNNVFYVKCQPYIITNKSELTLNNERSLFIKKLRKKYKNVEYLIEKDNENKIKKFEEQLLKFNDNKSLTDEDNNRIKEKQIELIDNLTKENIKEYTNSKKEELIELTKNLHYNLDFKLNKTNNGIDVIDKSKNDTYFSIILDLTNEENQPKIKYHKNCKDNYQQINNMWKQFCDGPNGYIGKMEKNRFENIQKNRFENIKMNIDNYNNKDSLFPSKLINKILNRKNSNPKNNLLYLMCKDKIPKKNTYIKQKPIDINRLKSKCSIKGGKLSKKRKYYKKKRTTFKIRIKKRRKTNKKRRKTNKNTRKHNKK